MFTQITWGSLHHHGIAVLWYSSYLKLLKIELKLIVRSRRFEIFIQDIDISTRAKTFACIAIICWCDWCQDQASKGTKSRCWSDPTNTSDTQHLQSLVRLNNQQKKLIAQATSTLNHQTKKHQHLQICIVWDG